MAEPRERTLRLLPSPREVEPRPGAFRPGPGVGVRLGTGSPAEQAAAERLGERPGWPPGGAGVTVAETGGMDPEGFELLVEASGVRLTGGSGGLRHGAEALAQLAGAGASVPAVRIGTPRRSAAGDSCSTSRAGGFPPSRR